MPKKPRSAHETGFQTIKQEATFKSSVTSNRSTLSAMKYFSVLMTPYTVLKKNTFWIVILYSLSQYLLIFWGKMLPPFRDFYPKMEAAIFSGISVHSKPSSLTANASTELAL